MNSNGGKRPTSQRDVYTALNKNRKDCFRLRDDTVGFTVARIYGKSTLVSVVVVVNIYDRK